MYRLKERGRGNAEMSSLDTLEVERIDEKGEDGGNPQLQGFSEDDDMYPNTPLSIQIDEESL